MKTVYYSLNDIPETLRSEYEPRDGKYVLKLEGEVPGLVRAQELADANAKLAEFRDNNRSLKGLVTELEAKLKPYEGIDPAEYAKTKADLAALEKAGARKPEDLTAAVKAQIETLQATVIDPLKKKLEESEKREAEKAAALAKKELEGALRSAGARVGVDERAMDDFLRRGLDVFVLDDSGKPLARKGDTPVFSKQRPGESLSPEEWATDLTQEAPHLFKQSTGGGAKPGSGPPAAKRFVSDDPIEFGRNIEAIAKGEATVVPSR